MFRGYAFANEIAKYVRIQEKKLAGLIYLAKNSDECQILSLC
jgi:hypothetical protein